MDQETVGTVVAVYRQWWLKINTKSVRFHAMDGAVFPHVLKVRYHVNGKDYFKRKFLNISPDYLATLKMAKQYGYSEHDAQQLFNILGVERPAGF